MLAAGPRTLQKERKESRKGKRNRKAEVAVGVSLCFAMSAAAFANWTASAVGPSGN
jgi:hypothetical protein